jgi:hypothetical protein
MRLAVEQSAVVRCLWRRLALVSVVAALVAATSATGVADASVSGGTRNPRVINDWNAIAVTTITAANGNAKAFNYYAYVHVAVYNAVVGITRRYQLYQWSRLGPENASPAAAAVAAAYNVLLHYFPGSSAALTSAYDASIAGIPIRGRAQGIAYGEASAANIIELRAHDGREDASVVYTESPAASVWRPLSAAPAAQFLAPWLAKVHPFTLNSNDQFDPGPPPQMDTALYATELNEIKAKGGTAPGSRTADEESTANFFFDTAVGPLQAGLRDLATRHELDISRRARMFAAVEVSMADALGAVWNAKLKYHWWRPITAIQMADTDGNPATEADPSWQTFKPTPPYPDWVSGLCSVYGSAGRALARVIGDDIDLTVTSPVAGTRTYHSTAVLNADAQNARVWSGIHFRTADVAGSNIGIQVANWALDHNFGRSD